MPLRVVLTLIISFMGGIAAFFNAFYGLIAYAFWSYTYPENVTWGLLPIEGLSYIVGAIVVLTTILQRKRIFSNNPTNYMIIVFWFLCLVAVFTAGMETEAVWKFKFFTRVILIALIITVLVDDLKRFRHYLWAIVIFIGLIAARSGIVGTLKGEVGGATGGFGGVIDDRNFMAVILCVVIPIIFYMIGAERNKWSKLFLMGILIGNVLALILTYARAGFLGLAAIGIFFIAKSRHKVAAVLVGIIAAAIFFAYFLPKEYKDRISTITKTDIEKEDVDMSAAQRLIAWRTAIEMIKDKPITGIGFYCSEKMMEKYTDPVTNMSIPGISIHNTILQVGAEVGLPALLLYIGIFFLIYRRLGKIKSKMAGGTSGNKEIWHYATMFQVAFIGFFASAFFVNAAFIDISWHLAGLTIALEQIAGKGS